MYLFLPEKQIENINEDISDVEEFQYDQVDPEFEQESEAELLVEELINNEELIDDDEEIPETA
ncbi:19148_t:CDS:2, partial [Cetraspora pellucida]